MYIYLLTYLLGWLRNSTWYYEYCTYASCWLLVFCSLNKLSQLWNVVEVYSLLVLLFRFSDTVQFVFIVLFIAVKLCCTFVNTQVNPCYTSTFVFDNDFPAMLDSSPEPGECTGLLSWFTIFVSINDRLIDCSRPIAIEQRIFSCKIFSIST